MKIAFIARSSLQTVSGGDTTQVVKTADELGKLGVEVHIFKASEKIPYGEFDLLHFFNLIRPADHLYHIRKSNKPYVVSPIYLDYSAFDKAGRGKWSRRIFTIMGKSGSEYIKNFYRYARRQDRLKSPEYLLGHARAMRSIVKGAALLLPNSLSEFQRVKEDFNVDSAWQVVPNGIDPEVFGRIPAVPREDKIISVAQIYGRKNQHALIEVSNELNVPLVIIGKSPPNHRRYFDYCRNIARKQVTFYSYMPQKKLVRHYASAKVHALPSWFETTGLSSLEAGALGCNLVVGEGGDTADYFTGLAHFCRANDRESIKQAVKKALELPVNPLIRETILEKYTWKAAALSTLQGYKRVLKIE